MSSSTMARASVCRLEVAGYRGMEHFCRPVLPALPPWMGPSSNTRQSSVHSLFPLARSPGQPLLFSSLLLS